MLIDIHFRVALAGIAALHLVGTRAIMRRGGGGISLRQPRAEGPLLAAGAALFILGYGLSVLAYLLNPGWMAWSALPLPGMLRWCGAPLMALGAAVHLWGSHHLGANLTVTISTRERHQLITTGPYRWVRHPLYAGGMLESIGVCLLLANGAVALFAAGFWAVVAWRTRLEEAQLVAAFGGEYHRYQREVGRFVPKWGRGPDQSAR